MTRFQLRRLALQATRRPELLPVLQDALLEHPTYGPHFEGAIERAEGAAASSPWGPRYQVDGYAVIFDPHAWEETDRFLVSLFYTDDLDWSQPTSWIRWYAKRGRSVVYVARKQGSQ